MRARRAWLLGAMVVATGGSPAACVDGGESPTTGATGAGGASAGSCGVTEHRSNVAHAIPNLTYDQQATFAADGQAFGLDLYRKVAAKLEGQNVVVSPVSASEALAMLAVGARGATLDEMRTALHFTLPEPVVDEGFNWLRTELADRPEQALATLPPDARSKSTMDLSIVDALFAQKGVELLGPFLDTLAAQYDAGVVPLDFAGDAEGARRTINAWVDCETSHRIQDLLPPGATEGSVLVFVNALSMGVPWQSPFGGTADAPFTLLDGSETTVPMMHRADTQPVPYVADADLEAAALPLLGGELEVVLVVPRAGKFETVEASLDGSGFAALQSALVPTGLAIALPKLRFTSEAMDLEPALQDLGMKLAFINPDFSGIGVEDPVVFVLQKTMVAFDEGGIEAAAATAVGTGGGSYQEPPTTAFEVDRPFLLGIRDRATGALLFWGRIVDPRVIELHHGAPHAGSVVRATHGRTLLRNGRSRVRTARGRIARAGPRAPAPGRAATATGAARPAPAARARRGLRRRAHAPAQARRAEAATLARPRNEPALVARAAATATTTTEQR